MVLRLISSCSIDGEPLRGTSRSITAFRLLQLVVLIAFNSYSHLGRYPVRDFGKC